MSNTMPQDAYNTLFYKVYAPVFFQKLAQDFGIVPANDQQRLELLEIAELTRQARENGIGGNTKTAGNSMLTDACDGLKEVLKDYGVATGAVTTREKDTITKVANFTNDPSIQLAALEMQEYFARLAESSAG